VRDILVVGIFAIGVLMALKRPWIGVMLWTWISVMNPHRFCWGFAAEAPLAAIAVGVTLFGLLFTRERQNPFMGAPVKWLAAFSLWVVLSWMLGYGFKSSDPILWYLDYDLFKRVMKTFFMIFVTLALLRNRHQIMAFVWMAVVPLAILGAKGGIFTITTFGQYLVWGPPGSFIYDNNEFALALVTIVPLLVLLIAQMRDAGHKRIALALAFAMGLSAVAAIGTQSRGGFLALSAMGAVLWWRSRYKAKLALAFVALVALILMTMPDSYWDRIHSILDYQNDGSSMGRIRSWNVAIQVALNHVTGAGMLYQHPIVFHLFDLTPGPDQGKLIAAHSIYFQILGNHGFIGLFLYMMIGWTTWRSAAWLRRNARKIPEAAWAAELGSLAQVSMAGFALGGAFLSLAYVDLPFNIMVMVVLTRRWVEKRGWESDPRQGFFDYCFGRHRKVAARAA